MVTAVKPIEGTGPGPGAGPAGCRVHPFRSGSDNGFTMIELGIALALIAVMMTVVAVNYGNWREYYRYSSAVSEVDSAFRTARLKAIGRQMALDVFFEAKTDEDLRTAGWGGYSDGVGLVVRYPYQDTPTATKDYSQMALVYDPDKFNVHVDTGTGMVDLGHEHFTSMGSCELVGAGTDDWKRTLRFNSRGFGLRRLEATGGLTQLPFRFLFKTPPTSSRKQGIIFTVSPIGRIARTTAAASLLDSE